MIISRRAIIAGAVIIIAALSCFFIGQEIIKISDGLQQKENLTRLLALRIAH